MADRFPLIVDSTTGTVKELPSGDNLNLSGSNVVNTGNINATSISATNSSLGISTATSTAVNGRDTTPIVGINTYYITPSGNDITGQGSISFPWKTLYRVFEYLAPKSIIDDGDTAVIINVGVGTYNHGLKITNTGSNYIRNDIVSVSGGSGSGAFVGIYTATGTNGIVTNVIIVDGGKNYVAGESLGVTTSFGTGLAFTAFNVSSSGTILGPVFLQHPQGHLIDITGVSPVGTKPGQRGNHFYNQCGVGVGSNPAGTGPNFSWSPFYDSTSPAGAYPNPMINGRGNTSKSNSYNASILESYYQSKLYFHGSNGFTSGSGNIRLSNLLIMYKNAQGFAAYNQGQEPGSNLGITNLKVSSNPLNNLDLSLERRLYSSDIRLGKNISFHNFSYGIIGFGAGIDATGVTATNTYIGARAFGGGGSFNASLFVSTSNEFGGLLNSGYSFFEASGIWISNNDLNGVQCEGRTFNFIAGAGAGIGQSTVIANNSGPGVVSVFGADIVLNGQAGAATVYGSVSTGQMQIIGGFGFINASGASISAGAGIAVTSVPAPNTSGTNILPFVSI